MLGWLTKLLGWKYHKHRWERHAKKPHMRVCAECGVVQWMLTDDDSAPRWTDKEHSGD